MVKEASALLNSGLQVLNNDSTIDAYTFIGIPLGSRIIIIKDKKLELKNPLIHIDSKIKTSDYTYPVSSAYLSTGSSIKYDAIIHHVESNMYYFIIGKKAYNENNVHHYYLQQFDASNILILDSIDDPKLQTLQNDLYDVICMPELLKLFEDNNIKAYPKLLQLLNRDLLMDKALFIQVINSETINVGFNGTFMPRIDTIRIYYHNYNRTEIFNLFKVFRQLIAEDKLNICNVDNIYDIKQEESYALDNNIVYYSEFSINYNLVSNVSFDIVKYIKSVMVNIHEIRNKV